VPHLVGGGLSDSSRGPCTSGGLPFGDVSDDTAKRRLDNFIGKVTCKRDSPLIREPPKQPPAKLVLLWRSRRLAAQPLS
jgi:hypothetical protein